MAKLPGQDARPTKNQKRPPKKPKAVKVAQNVGDRVANAINRLNPFD